MGAEVGEAPVADVEAVDPGGAAGLGAESEQDIGEEGSGFAFVGGEGSFLSGLQDDIGHGDGLACGGGDDEAVGFDGGGRMECGGFSGGGLDGEVEHVSELVHGGHDVVPSFEFFPEFAEGSDDAGHDDFAGDELAEGELLADDEPSADAEEGCAGEDLQREEACDLAHENPEVGGPGFEVGVDEGRGFRGGEGEAAATFEEDGVGGDLFEPVDELVFEEGFADTGGDGAAAECEEDDGEEGEEDGGEGEQDGVVQGEEDESGGAAEHEIDAVEEEEGGGFLGGDDFHETVDHFWGVDFVERGGVQPREAVCEVGGGADEDAALDDFGDVVLEATDDGLDEEECEEGEGEGDEGLEVGFLFGSEGEVADDGVDGEGGGEVEEAGEEGEDEEHPDGILFEGEEGEEAALGGGVMMVVGMGCEVSGGEDGFEEDEPD